MFSGDRASTLTFIPRAIKVQEDKPYKDAQGHRARFRGFSGTATAGQSTNIEYKVTEDRWISGVELILKDQVQGDYVHFEIVDVDGVYYPSGTVLDRFGENWNLAEGVSKQGPYELSYWAKVSANLYLRVVYVSTGQSNVSVGVNCYLHKKD